MDFSINNLSQKAEIPAVERVFGDVSAEPTQDAVCGIKFDFCDGVRVRFPGDEEFHLSFIDDDSDEITYACNVQKGAMAVSVKKFFVNWRIEIRRKGETEVLFQHKMNLENQNVLIQLPVGTLGDSIAWFSYVERFAFQNKCHIVCSVSPEIRSIFERQYPNYQFTDKKETQNFDLYAAYNLGLFFGGDVDHQPYDFRQVGLHRTAGCILGVKDLSDIPPRVDLSTKRKIKEKYVCVAAQASSQCKYWNNPSGWREVVTHLKSLGYRVLCVDMHHENGQHFVWNHIPYGAEDFTGALPLQERIDIIKDAEFFIGLSSGLSWLAWCCHVPVIMISGFTEPWNEFTTPYRVINIKSCHGCWNDMRCEFNHFDFLWCPRNQKNIDKQFECTKTITSKQVIKQINKVIQTKESGNEHND